MDARGAAGAAADPAARVIAKFGGQSALARALGINQSTVQHWVKTGQIPSWRHEGILRAAREEGIALERNALAGIAPPADGQPSGAAGRHALGQPATGGAHVAGPVPSAGAFTSRQPLFFAGRRAPAAGALQHGRADPIPATDHELAAMRQEIGQLREAVAQLVDEVRQLRQERGGNTTPSEEHTTPENRSDSPQ